MFLIIIVLPKFARCKIIKKEENTNNMRLIYHQGMKRGGLAAAFVAVKIGAEAHTISRTNSRY